MKNPKIRFKGCMDDWEQRKFADVVEDYIEKSTVENQYPVLTSSQQKGIVLQDDYFSGDRVSQSGNLGYFIIPRGYFAYRSRSDNDIFVFNRNDCVDMGIISYFYPVFRGNGVDSEFLLRRLNYGLERQIKIASEGTGQHVLSLKKFKNIVAFFPSYKEQQKIGSYFKKLDTLITLHHRKCKQTKILKKYMLQKMFPQDGASVPEIRFEGFTDDWEQRKLKEILERRMEQRQQSDEYPRLAFASGQGVIPLSERKTNNREQLTKDEFAKKYLVTEIDDIVYNPANVKYGAIDRNKCGRGLISPIYVTFTTNEIAGFIERIVTSHNFQQRALKFEEGTVTKRQSVNPEDLVTLDIMVAPQREEQEKISNYFDSLDNLITLHQRKCEELQYIKKYMLQNMFV